ncbi:hypothetical protein CDAR_265191 [Caerostris darwini]|uniref:Uncharacterized protein n=1 Tax=Caerostris darwini TaxID=1538125 RepID=A0AAV4W698_9ARAC|nr:hypothetical protein CDAR_265191 [Caerostris darwini]
MERATMSYPFYKNIGKNNNVVYVQCDRTCGPANKTRVVECKSDEETLDDSECDVEKKPSEFETCNLGPLRGNRGDYFRLELGRAPPTHYFNRLSLFFSHIRLICY